MFRRDEIRQFNTLISCFNLIGRIFNLGNARSYHGRVCQVEFSVRPPWTRTPPGTLTPPRCELADVLFVTFNGAEMRIAFLQAKSKNSAISLPVKLDNAEQFVVLAQKPLVTVWHCSPSSRWNDDVLSGAILASVGSFGIFFGSPLTPVRFNYLIANLLHPVSGPNIAAGRPHLVSGSFDCARPMPLGQYSYGFYERTECVGLRDFGAALFSLEIGTPIHAQVDQLSPKSTNKLPASLNTRMALRKWTLSQLADEPEDRLLIELLNSPHLQDLPNEPVERDISLGVKHVVILNTSEMNGA